MRMIYLPMAAALALGLTTATMAADNAAAPEDNPMEHMRDNTYYGGSVYVAPTVRPYAYSYAYPHRPYYYRSGPVYSYYGDPYYRRYDRSLLGLHLPFFGLHIG
jgi:hypothetical protein